MLVRNKVEREQEEQKGDARHDQSSQTESENFSQLDSGSKM